MNGKRKYVWCVLLTAGMAVGLIVGRMMPDNQVHAVATDRIDDFAIATGFVDDELEAIYFLDVLTGTLKAKVVSNRTRNFQASYEVNLNAALKTLVEGLNLTIQQSNQAVPRGSSSRPDVQMPSAPNYVLVTGQADIRQTSGGRTRPSPSLVYVAEINTGIVMAFVLPWESGAHLSNAPYMGELMLWAGDQFTSALVRSP